MSVFQRIVHGVIVILFSGTCGAAGNIKWHAVKQQMSEEIHELLVQSNRCEAVASCSSRDIALFRQTSDGVEISVYGITDVKLKSEIMSIAAKGMALHGMNEVVVSFYRITKKESLAAQRLIRLMPVSSFTMRGKYAND